MKVVLLGLLLATASSPRIAARDAMPPALRVKVLMTCLVYDRNLSNGRADGLRIGVAYPKGDQDARAEAEDILKALRSYSSNRVQGLSIEGVDVPLSDRSSLNTAIAQNRLNLLYVSGGSEPLLTTILEVSQERKILTLSGDEELVRAGVALGVVVEDNKPKILVNRKAVDAQGGEMETRLLRLARVVGP